MATPSRAIPTLTAPAATPPRTTASGSRRHHLPGFAGPLNATWVEYDDPQHEIEYYNDAQDPYQLDNIAGTLTKTQQATLHKVLVGLHQCHTATACWRAGIPQ